MTALPGQFVDLWLRPSRGPVLSAARVATSRRVLLLISAITLMGLADLYCTLAYMTTVGLPEANPIARWLVRFGTTETIIGFKLLTMALSCWCLYIGRAERRMEVCAWACTAILLGLSIHWIGFNRSISEHTNLIAYLADKSPCPRSPDAGLAHGSNWVKLEE
ncbi:MAG: DUF5658 family protein [Phycisphaerales bacterium]